MARLVRAGTNEGGAQSDAADGSAVTTDGGDASTNGGDGSVRRLGGEPHRCRDPYPRRRC